MADVNLVLQVGSESAAVAYAQQANASAQASAASAESASESATAASGSATQAANSASAAAGSAAQANGYATNAGASASAAAQSATAAETAKTNAGNSATAAASSASTAATKAGEASASATSAASSATAAAGSATSAASSATAASGSATTASTKASEAAASATAAQTAKTGAETAQGKAETAQGAAEAAAESISASAAQIATNTQDISDLRSALSSETSAREAADEQLAAKDGTYEDLTSGNAEQLLSDVYTENSEPYLFRKTGGSDNVGDREFLDKIVGGTLNWNQLVPTTTGQDSGNYGGVDITKNNDGSFTLNGSCTSNASYVIVSGFAHLSSHKYLFCGWQKFGSNTSFFSIGGTKVDDGNGGMFDGLIGTTWNLRVDLKSGDSFSNFVFKPQVIDITSLFGSTIADYVYTLETATAGAGVAWLRQYIDIDSYHPYSAPTMKHVEGLVSHDTTGLNQWDEEWENGRYNITTGAKTSNATSLRCKNHIKVLPNIRYYIKAPVSAYFVGFDANGNCIGFLLNDEGISATKNTTITMPSNCYEVVFYCDNYSTYENNICLNLSSSKNRTYEPYQKRSYPLDSSVVLRGVPTLVDGRLKYDGDEYLYDGKINRRYDIVDMGTLDWTVIGTTRMFFQTNSLRGVIKPPASGAVLAHIICPKYVTVKWDDATYETGRIAINWDDIPGKLSCINTAYTDVASFKAAMSGTYLVFEKLTPSTEQAEPFRQLQICDTYGTEEFVTTSEVPVGTETRYPEDLKSKIEGLPWDLSMIAPIEGGTKASQAYTAGQYFLHNNVFCKALTSIASGATFTLNTNYSETTIAAELYTALH